MGAWVGLGGRRFGGRRQRRTVAGIARTGRSASACGCRWPIWTMVRGARLRGLMRRLWPNWRMSLGLPVNLGQWRPTRAAHFESDARSRSLRLADRDRPGAWGLGRRGRPHARRPGRDDPAPDHPRHGGPRTGGHASETSARSRPEDHAGPAACSASRARRFAITWPGWGNRFVRTSPTRT